MTPFATRAILLFTLAALILTGGALGDRFGTGRVFSAGIALFVVTFLFNFLAARLVRRFREVCA